MKVTLSCSTVEQIRIIFEVSTEVAKRILTCEPRSMSELVTHKIISELQAQYVLSKQYEIAYFAANTRSAARGDFSAILTRALGKTRQRLGVTLPIIPWRPKRSKREEMC